MKSPPSARKTSKSSRAETAERIAIEASRLARTAKANDFPLIAYLIDMAVLEAWREAGEPPPDSATDDSPPAQSS